MSVEQHLSALRIVLIAHLVVIWLSVALIAAQSTALAALAVIGALVATNERRRVASLAFRIERDLALSRRVLV
jgi:hypothetical protein